MESTFKNTKSKKSKLTVRQMAIVGMLSGVSIFLGVTKLGFIPLPAMNATILHLPVIIGGILEGPLVGGLIGLIFGLFSMFQAITAPTLTSFMFLNPIIALIPRVLIGVWSYYIYKVFKTKKDTFKLTITAFLASMINTIGVLGLGYLIYADKLSSIWGLTSNKAVGLACLTIGATNGIPEAIVAAVIVTPIIISMKKIKKSR